MAIFQQGMFLFDPKNDTPETVARKRALVAQIMGSGRAPQTIGEGLNAIGDGIVANVMNRRADEATKAGQESAAAAWNPFVSALGPQQFPDAPGAPTSADYSDTRVKTAFGDNADEIRKGLIDRGMSPQIADAFVMNFQDESGLNPGINEKAPIVPGSRGGFGLAQWTGPRRRALEAYAAQNGKPVSDTGTQLDFLMSELSGPEKSAWAKIQGADTTGGAAAAIVNNFLRPAESHRVSRERRYLANTDPVQVASLDPSAGIVPDQAMAAATGKGDRLSMTQAAPVQMQPGPIPNPSPEQSAFLGRMTDPQPMGGAPMPMQGTPAPQASPQPQQVAQAQPAGPDLSSVPVTAGGNAGTYQPGQGPSLQMLMQAAANPWLNDSQKAVINMMLKQQLDPNAGLDRRYREAQIRNIESEIAKRDDPNARDKFGNSVIWGQNENGDWVAMQPSSGGGLVPAQTPEGIKLSPPGISDLNLGTRYATRDRNGNIISEADIDNAGKAADTATGKSQGEAAASYRSMSSKLPGLEKVVSDLGNLADEATYTKAGQWVDWFRKEAGAEPRPEAIARTKYIAMVDNQILPLLRDTFGAQFTVQEGESLRATLGDPNKTPAEKKEVLRAFIEQKKRDVAALAVQGGVEAAPQPQQTGKRLRFNPETGELE